MIGFSANKVTPPLGTPLAGYASRSKGAQGVLDDLYCKCLSLSTSKGVYTIVVLDLLGVSIELAKKVKSIVGENVALIATHTHSGPYLSKASKEYLDELTEKIVECIEISRKDLREVKFVSSSHSSVPELVYNRRDPIHGVTDPTLRTIFLEDREYRVPLAIAHYTCHPVVLGPDNYLISADWPGALARNLTKLTNIENVIVVNGCCGNINPYTPSTKLSDPYDRRGASYEEVESFGRALAHVASYHIETRWRHREEALDEAIAITKSVYLELWEPESLDVDSIASRASEGDRYAKWLLERLEYVDNVRKELGKHVRIEVTVIAFSKSTALVILPSEMFVEHQLWITSRSPFSNTIVVAYSEPYLGYIPTIEAFREGGYEAQFPVSMLSPGSGEKLRLVALSALLEAYSQLSS